MNVFSQMVAEYASLFSMLTMAAGALGIGLGGYGLRNMALSKLQREPGVAGLWPFASGAMLVNAGTWMDGVSQTFLQTSSYHALAYSGASGPGASAFVAFAVDTVQLAGFVGVIRGLYGLRLETRGSGAPGGRATSLGQIVFGTLAVNIVPTLHLAGNTIGGPLQSFINRVVV
ncbi:MAG: hypothetical protein M0Z25_09360 [Nitrospiraceae bacterium]|nr:hypothetical protein [Nitrospiraceae bacterium]